MIRIAGIPLCVVVILLVELVERFCYYSIYGSMRFFLQTMLNYNVAEATSITSVFSTACYMTCLLGGALGDRFLGRFLTIGLMSSLYVVGTFMVAFATVPGEDGTIPKPDVLFFVGAFGGIAVGTGGIKPIVCNFGADQIEGEDEEKTKERFFSYFYWTINIGASVALGFMTTLATNPTQFGIKEGYGFFTAYLIASFSMMGCVLLFFAASCSYIKKFLTSNTRIFRPVFSALWYSATQSARGAIAVVGWLLAIPFFILAFVQAFSASSSCAVAAFVIAVIQLVCLIYAHLDNSFIVDRVVRDEAAQSNNQGRSMIRGQVAIQEIRQTFQTIPLLLIANTIFSFCYSLMMAPFTSQSCQMRLFLGQNGSGNQINGSLFNLGDALAIIIFIPIFESFLYPAIERRWSRPISSNEKLIGGFFWAAMAMGVATVFEVQRVNSAVLTPPFQSWPGQWDQTACLDPDSWPDGVPPLACQNNYKCVDVLDLPATSKFEITDLAGYMGSCKYNPTPGHECDFGDEYKDDIQDWCSNCAPSKKFGTANGQSAGIYMSDFNGFWMFFPYAFIGIGEILVNPVLYYYAYSMTPGKTQSVIQSVNLVFQGAYPPALVAVFTTLLSGQTPNNLNEGNLWIFYVIGLVFIVVGTPIFFIVKNACVLEQPLDGQDEDEVATQLSSSVIGAQLTGSFTGPVS